MVRVMVRVMAITLFGGVFRSRRALGRLTMCIGRVMIIMRIGVCSSRR